MILLMEEFLHHLGCIKACKEWDISHINWCRISAINSSRNIQLPILEAKTGYIYIYYISEICFLPKLDLTFPTFSNPEKTRENSFSSKLRIGNLAFSPNCEVVSREKSPGKSFPIKKLNRHWNLSSKGLCHWGMNPMGWLAKQSWNGWNPHFFLMSW